jgi:prolyl oligopeptidase
MLARRTLVRNSLLAAALPPAFLIGGHASAEEKTRTVAIDYPETRRGDVVDDLFGERVPDPYRWLENDARSDDDVAAWVAAQNELTETHLASLPGRDIFRERLTALLDHDQVSAPDERGGAYFHTRLSGRQNQAVLLARDGVDGDDRVLIDPNAWSADGTIALGAWAAADDGSLLAYEVQDGGSDWRTINVLDVATGEVLADELTRVRFSVISWVPDGSGFFYARYPESVAAAGSQAGLADHALYFHAIGTPQAADRLLYATPDRPELLHIATVTDGGRFVEITSTPGAGTNSLTVVDLASDDWEPRPVVADFDAEWTVVGTVDTTLYVMTSRGADRRKIVTIDLAAADPAPVDLVAEDDAVLNEVRLVGDRLLAMYLVDAQTELRRFALDGSPDGTVELPGIGTAGAFRGRPDDNEAFFLFTSYNVPFTVYRYDVATNTSEVWAAPEIAFDLDRLTVEQRFYRSKDGTEVPLFVVRRDDVTGPAPTLLHAYGGFGIGMVPAFYPLHLAWLEQGGVFVVANIRGGDEYGKAWHDAARFERKQNAFDDFIAAGEYLMAAGITPPDGLAIHGESNGGLLVGAAANQRPDLFAAALPGVGVMDMLRFNQFTGGAYWMGDFGDPTADEEQFRTLLAYSPYHNVTAGKKYPAILATTADADDRVVPGHTFKYIAALQHADVGTRPHLVRVETRAGHGGGTALDRVIAETADRWAFAAYWTGLEVARP